MIGSDSLQCIAPTIAGLILLLFAGSTNAQSAADYWHFGTNASLRFTANGIQVLNSSQLQTLEGVASLSSPQGELLFYTEGDSVWNRNNTLMPNGFGLNGHPSSTQSAVACPYPGSESLYYIFTVDQLGQANGLQYSIVDMTLDGGMGDIDTNAKNIPLATPVCEKITVVEKCQRDGYWLFSRRINSDQFIAYDIDSNGIDSTNPIISPSSLNITPPNGQGIGYMKASPNGTYLGSCNWEAEYSNVELFKINLTTGTLYDPLIIPVVKPDGDSAAFPYGIEFSPDESFMYLSGIDHIYQYKLKPYHLDSILQSQVAILSAENAYVPSALQLAPDGRIYFNNNTYLGCIQQANLPGGLSDLSLDSIDLGSTSSGLGLPNFCASFFRSPFSGGTYCQNDSIFFQHEDSCAISTFWNFDDPNSGTSNLSWNNPTLHIFTDTGTYRVMLVLEYFSRTDTFFQNIKVQAPPEISVNPPITFCSGDSAVIEFDQPYTSYFWSDSTEGPTKSITTSSLLIVTATNACGTISDSLIFIQEEYLSLKTLSDTSICPLSSIQLARGQTFSSWLWSTGDTTSTIVLDTSLSPNLDPVDVWLIASNACGSDSDTMTLSFFPLPDASLPPDSVQCFEAPVPVLRPDQDSTIYTWFDGSNDLSKLVTQDTTIWLIASNICGSDTDSMEIRFHPEIKVEMGEDTFLCEGDSVVLNAAWPGATYQWTSLPQTLTGDLSGSIQVIYLESGSTSTPLGVTLQTEDHVNYIVTITEGPCTLVESRKISIQEEPCDSLACKFEIPNVFTPNGDGVNDVLRISNPCTDIAYRISIYNRWGQLVFFGNSNFNQWDGSVNGQPAADGTYYVVVEADGASVQRNSVTLIRE